MRVSRKIIKLNSSKTMERRTGGSKRVLLPPLLGSGKGCLGTFLRGAGGWHSWHTVSAGEAYCGTSCGWGGVTGGQAALERGQVGNSGGAIFCRRLIGCENGSTQGGRSRQPGHPG